MFFEKPGSKCTKNFMDILISPLVKGKSAFIMEGFSFSEATGS